ncbi:hypothetical protein HK102_000451 [Quaeritorhiza haematococci]|nr:hypothetical protein HK102_000451 [Quaeritorhiza haematococci]
MGKTQAQRGAGVVDALIIGGGPSGIVTLRNMLMDGRLPNVLLIERNDRTGGLWISHAPAYSSLQVLKQDWELHGVKVDDTEPERRASRDSIRVWCEKYVKIHKLQDHMEFSVECTNLEQLQGDLWRASLKNLSTGKEWNVTTRSVCVCTGLENLPRVPSFPGQETSKIPIVHNLKIRSKDDLPTDELIVVGGGPSSMDICQQADAAKTKKTYLLHRKAHLGVPDNFWPIFGVTEMSLMRFMFKTLRLPTWVVNYTMNVFSYLWAAWHNIPTWKPRNVRMDKDIAYVFRTELVKPIQEKRLVPLVTEIKSINGDEVVLSNGMTVKPQMIVCATGWNLDYKFMPFYKGVSFDDLQVKLFSRFLDIDHPGLFFVSIANGFMCANHNADIVSRCIVQYLTGDWKVPSREKMEKNIREVVLKRIALPGLFEMDLEAVGFKM